MLEFGLRWVIEENSKYRAGTKALYLVLRKLCSSKKNNKNNIWGSEAGSGLLSSVS